MKNRRERILRLLETMPGLTDREITDQLEGHSALQQPINALCRRMETKNIIRRTKRPDGLIGNYLVKESTQKNNEKYKPTTNVDINHNNDSVRSNMLYYLIELGFEKAGHWSLMNNDVAFSLDRYSRKSELLYAFIVNGDVKYIGKTTQEFYRRIYLYKNCGPSQRTNIRIRDKIRACLLKGSKTEIYAFVPKESMMYKDLQINLAAGLEDNLIKRIDPEWNIL